MPLQLFLHDVPSSFQVWRPGGQVMAITAKQWHACQLQQLQCQPPGVPVKQAVRIHLQSDGQLCQLLQLPAVPLTEAEPLRMHQHHLKAPVQRKGGHRLRLKLCPLRKRHFQQQRPGTLHAQPRKMVLLHRREIGHLRRREQPRQPLIRRQCCTQNVQCLLPPDAEMRGVVLPGVEVRSCTHGVHPHARQRPEHGQRHLYIFAAIIHSGQDMRVQVRNIGRFPCHLPHPLSCCCTLSFVWIKP